MAIEDVFDVPGTQINVVFQINPEGDTSAHGTVRIRDVNTNATKVFHATSGEGTTASCADADNDGRTGLQFIAASLVANDGEELQMSFTPTTGEIDEGGEHPGIILITDGTGTVLEFEGTILALSAANGPTR